MGGCCDIGGYGAVFSDRVARRDARRYRRKGLDETAREMVGFLAGRGIEGASVLEVGGGVGGIQLELLKAGAVRSVNVELSREYEECARDLAREADVETRIDRRIGDFVREADAIEPADAVVMHRVVCCYPDMPGLVGAAADRARRLLVFSFPRDTRLIRLGFRLANLWYRLRDFRAFVHQPDAMVAVAESRGLRFVHGRRGRMWQVAALEREGTPTPVR